VICRRFGEPMIEIRKAFREAYRCGDRRRFVGRDGSKGALKRPPHIY